MHIKRIREMTECLTEYGKCMIESGANGKNVNICDAEKIVDMIKDLCESERAARIAKCLEKDEEEGMMKYRLSAEDYKKYTAEELRDIDRKSRNIMYYSEPIKTDGDKHEMSRYDKSMYEHKKIAEKHNTGTPEDKQAIMRSAEAVLNIVFDDIDLMLDGASPEVKNLAKSRIMSRIQRYN